MGFWKENPKALDLMESWKIKFDLNSNDMNPEKV